jgi:hypothetical protein
MTVRALAGPFRWIFADSSITAHLARGATGLSAIVLSFAAPWSAAWPALILLPLALLVLRGCPLCWLHGTACAIQTRRSTLTTDEGESR